MTSNYPMSCLEVRRKQKVNKPILQGCPRKNICKYQHFNHIVFSCSACLQKIVFQIIMLLLSDMPFIKHEACTLHDAIVSHHQNGRIVTFKP